MDIPHITWKTSHSSHGLENTNVQYLLFVEPLNCEDGCKCSNFSFDPAEKRLKMLVVEDCKHLEANFW